MSERRTLALAAAVTGASIPGFFAIFSLWAAQGLAQADASDPLKVLVFAAVHPGLVAALYVLGVVMHLAALLLVIGLHRRTVASSPLWVSAGSALGLLWVGADILQNLMHYGIFLGSTTPEMVAASSHAADALWHAGHFGGGAWLLVLAGTSSVLFGRAYRALCWIAGVVFLLHAFVFPLAAWWFFLEFLLVPVWAFATAAAIAKNPAFEEAGGAEPRGGAARLRAA